MVYTRREEERLQVIEKSLRKMRKIINKKSKRSSGSFFSEKFSKLLHEKREILGDPFEEDLLEITKRLNKNRNSGRQYYEDKEDIPTNPLSIENSKIIFQDHSFIVRVSLINGEVFMIDGEESETTGKREKVEENDEEYIPPSYEDELENNNMEVDTKEPKREEIVEEISIEETNDEVEEITIEDSEGKVDEDSYESEIVEENSIEQSNDEVEEIMIEDSEGEVDEDGYESDQDYSPPGIKLKETEDEIFILRSVESKFPLIDVEEKEEEEITVLHVKNKDDSDKNGNVKQVEAIIID